MESSDGGLLVCRITVEGSDFSDGEQHYLPILSDKEKVMNTVAFSQIGAGTKTIDTDQLFPVKEATNHLTIEYTNNPAWLMIKTLPSVATDNTKNAISQAVAFYANSIAKSIISKSPKIAETIRQWTMTPKTDSKSPFESLNEELENSPWLQEALHEHDQQGQLINYLDRSEEHTSELQSRHISYAVFCLKKKNKPASPPLPNSPHTYAPPSASMANCPTSSTHAPAHKPRESRMVEAHLTRRTATGMSTASS